LIAANYPCGDIRFGAIDQSLKTDSGYKIIRGNDFAVLCVIANETESNVVVRDDVNELGVVVNTNSLVLLCILVRDLQGPILAAIIYNDVFEVPIRLRQDTLNAFGYVIRSVENGREYRNKGLLR